MSPEPRPERRSENQDSPDRDESHDEARNSSGESVRGEPNQASRPVAEPIAAPVEPAGPLIERLAAAVVSTARGLRGRWFFVGWTRDGLPAATTTVEDLGETARRDLANFRGARLEPRKVPFATIIPVSYVMTGSAIDFADTPDRRAEDQVSYSVLDAAGARRDLAIGELSILGAIGAAREPWQSHQAAAPSMLAVDAVPLYSLFATLPGMRADTGLAMLFESTIQGSTNEPAFRSCVRHTIGRLLVLDESQPADKRKGYLHAAGRLAGVPPEGGVLGSLVWMRKAGLVDFEDSWLQRQKGRGRRIRGGLMRALRGMGMVEVSDELLDELYDSRPDYDVDQLELGRLLDLAAEMHRVGREALRADPELAERYDLRRKSSRRKRERRR